MDRKLSKKNTKYMNSKLSKKNTVYNRTKFSNKNSLCATRKLSKRYKIKGGKPAMPASYTYFIVAHGSYDEKLDPIKVPLNSSIITLNKLDKVGSGIEVLEMINFYLQGFKLFERNDQSKTKTFMGDFLIDNIQRRDEQQKRIRHQIKVQEAIQNGELPPPTPDFTSIYFTDVRNHVYGDQGFMNDNNITFLPQEKTETQYLGVARLNNDNGMIEFFDNYILYQLEKIYKKNHQKLRLSSLLNFLFNKNDQPLEFDEHTTIITFMCRSFGKRLSEDDQEILRTRSSESDQVSSDYPQPIQPLQLTALNNENMWLSIGTPIKLINDITGTIINFSLPNMNPPHYLLNEYLIELDDPTKKLSIKSCVILKNRANSTENGLAGTISDLFDRRTNMWPVTLFDGTQQNVLASDMDLSPFTIGSCVYFKPTIYQINTRVRLSKLTNPELNNQTGIVISQQAKDTNGFDRIGVKLDLELDPKKPAKSIKPDNLQEILQVTGFNSKTKQWIVKNCINEVKHINHSDLEPCEFQNNELIFYNTQPNDEIGQIGNFNISTNEYTLNICKKEVTEDGPNKKVELKIYKNEIKIKLHEILNQPIQSPIIKKLISVGQPIYINHFEIMHIKNDKKLAQRFNYNQVFCSETFNSIMKLYNEYRNGPEDPIYQDDILKKVNEALEGDCLTTFTDVQVAQLERAQRTL